VTAAELRDADNRPDEWLTYSGSYNSHRHSSLREINRDNVGQLRVAWLRQFPAADERVETSPIVRGLTMFVTEPPSSVYALDAASGRILWSYSRDLPARLSLCCKPVNRGVAVLDDRVFVGTLDAHLIALDAHTGTVMWDIAVADALKNYSITAAPLAVDGMVVTGVAGGEFGMRGFIDAYDAISGQRRWRFYTVPAPGEPGSETWRGDSWRTGGAPTWLTGSFDPDLGLIYWAVGNRFPNYEDGGRGNELYSNSVVALDAATGKLRWYFQFTPGDTHDWDAVQIPVLVDATLGQSPRKLLAWANRNAFFYLLDRVTGKFLLGIPFARQTWADGLDASGRPQVRPESRPSREGSEVYPNQIGATNWWSPSYDPTSQLLYVPVIDRGAIFFESAEVMRMTPDKETTIVVKALDVTTGRIRWQYKRSPRLTLDEVGGLLSTAGGIVFGGDNEVFFALDAETGAELWRFNTGGLISAASVTYKVDGQQYVAIAAGRSILAFALPR
jgi:alcohol dehydrogenase (cytochrome c)